MRRIRFVLDAGAACFDGHFPGRPVIPGVALLDAAIEGFGLTGPLHIAQTKFLRPCLPGMPLELVLDERADGVELRVEHAGELMASARVRRRRSTDDTATRTEAPTSHG